MTYHNNTISINGIDLYYEIHGEGIPLLMLHGFTGSSAGLVAGFKHLTSGFQLIIPDLRGHGQSTNPSKKFTFQEVARDILGLLEHLNIKACVAIGFSGGACTLLQMAYQQPDIIKAMIIVSATPYFPEKTRDIMKQYTIADPTSPEWIALRNVHRHGDEQIKMLIQQARDMADDRTDMNFNQASLNKIRAKTLIVQGDKDPLYPIETTIELFHGIPNSNLWIIPEGGHVPINDKTMKQFNDYVDVFLKPDHGRMNQQ